MGQWGNQDNVANSVNWGAMLFQKGKGPAAQQANNITLYNNTTANAIVNKQVVGQFGVSVAEMRSSNGTSEGRKAVSPGWHIRRVGTGGRAGRVTYECLVSLTNMTSGATDDTQLP
jgi:hypothetical protein